MDKEGDERIAMDPRARGGRNPYQFSPEELRVMKECNRESFFQRCLPLGSLLGVGTYFACKTGYIRANPRFGAAPKVTVAVIIGYFVGKFSYQQKCAEKLMQLPNSQIGEMLRQRRKGFFQETLEPGIGPGMALAPFSGITGDSYSDVMPNNDIDTNRPSNEGLDDAHRPSMDNPIFEEEMPPLQKQATSYDELRRNNRDEFAQKRIGGGYRSSVSQTSTTLQQPNEEPTIAKARTNIYGDPI